MIRAGSNMTLLRKTGDNRYHKAAQLPQAHTALTQGGSDVPLPRVSSKRIATPLTLRPNRVAEAFQLPAKTSRRCAQCSVASCFWPVAAAAWSSLSSSTRMLPGTSRTRNRGENPILADVAGFAAFQAAVHALQKGDAEKALQTLHKAVKRHSNAALQNSATWLCCFCIRCGSCLYLAKSRQTFSKDKLQEAALHAFNQTVLLAGGSLGGKGGKGRKMQAAKGSDLEVALANQQLASRYLEASRLNRLGIQLDLQNRWEEAAVVLREAQKAAPGYDPLITSNLGTVIYKNATHRSSGWAEVRVLYGREERQAAPLYERARELVERAHQDLPGNPAVMKSLKEVQRLQSSLDAWRENAGLRELPVPKELLQAVAVRGTVVCTWSGGGSKFSKMALNLRASIRLNAPHWERAFVVLSLDNETLSFLQSQGITSWLYETLDIYMTRWRLLAGLLAEGFDVLLMDTDVVFLGDPFQHFFFDADLEVMTDHLFPERDLWDEKWRDEDGRSFTVSRTLTGQEHGLGPLFEGPIWIFLPEPFGAAVPES
eukprot:s6472_g2.t1